MAVLVAVMVMAIGAFVGQTQRRPTTSAATKGAASVTTAQPDGWDQVAAIVDQSVVNIETVLPEGLGEGTGIVLTSDGEIVTNAHVVEGSDQITVSFPTTGDSVAATLVGTDARHDIAVLRVDRQGLTAAQIGDSDAVRVGDPIAALGNAGGRGGDPIVAPGTVTALHQTILAADPIGNSAKQLDDLIQVEANVQPGDSGGPVVDARAKVIGVTSAAARGNRRTRSSAQQGFAIPINQAVSIVEEIEANGSIGGGSTSPTTANPTSRGILGVQVSPQANGVTVIGVEDQSPAQDAGMKVGDIIMEVDGYEIDTTSDLSAVLRDHHAGDTVTVTWQSGTRTREAPITLASP